MPRPQVDGIINLDKPLDATSMDMVRLAKRLTRVKRVGHAGSLDPIATGVLLICLGQATRRRPIPRRRPGSSWRRSCPSAPASSGSSRPCTAP